MRSFINCISNPIELLSAPQHVIFCNAPGERHVANHTKSGGNNHRMGGPRHGRNENTNDRKLCKLSGFVHEFHGNRRRHH